MAGRHTANSHSNCNILIMETTDATHMRNARELLAFAKSLLAVDKWGSAVSELFNGSNNITIRRTKDERDERLTDSLTFRGYSLLRID
jgi:hypothetical protein